MTNSSSDAAANSNFIIRDAKAVIQFKLDGEAASYAVVLSSGKLTQLEVGWNSLSRGIKFTPTEARRIARALYQDARRAEAMLAAPERGEG